MPVCGGGFTNAAQAVEVGAGAVGYHLGQSGVKVEGVGGGYGVHGLLQTISHAVVGVGVRDSTLGNIGQSVGVVVVIRSDSIVLQVPVGVVEIRYAVYI